jgi:uncharacterized membrane protein (DUF2068 family)
MENAHDIQRENFALKSIALFEIFKSVVVLLAGFGCLAMIHRDLEAVGEHLIAFLHLNPEQHFSALFLKTLKNLKNSDLVWMSLAASLYSILKFIEGYGLWHARVWAEWLAIITGGLYLPFEFYEIYEKVTWIRVSLTMINVALVVYLLRLRKIKVAERKLSTTVLH